MQIKESVIGRCEEISKIKLKGVLIFVEVEARKSDGVVFYHCVAQSQGEIVYFLGINYKNKSTFLAYNSGSLNDIVDATEIIDDKIEVNLTEHMKKNISVFNV